MDNPRLLPVALTNLRTSQGFLEKLLDICERVVSESGPAVPAHPTDKQVVLAVSLLAKMTDAMLMEIENCQKHGGTFSPQHVLKGVIDTHIPPKQEVEGAEIQRMRVIMDLCLQQGDIYRRRAFYQSAELETMRATVKSVYADLSATRTILNK